MLKSKWFIAEIIAIVALLLAIWLISFLKSFSSVDSSIFNALTALFSLFAFIAVVLTLILQYRQLQSQQEQFAQQNFETTLFNMLETQRQIIEQIEYVDNKRCKTVHGRQLFEISREDLHKFFFLEYKEPRGEDILYMINRNTFFNICEKHDISPEICVQADNLAPLDIISSLGDIKKNNNNKWIYFISEVFSEASYLSNYNHYFHHLYHILNLIKQNEDSETARGIDAYDKYKNYADIVRAQMSTAELWVLFYSSLGHPRMVKLLEHYAFLKNVDKDSLLDPSHKEFYKYGEDS